MLHFLGSTNHCDVRQIKPIHISKTEKKYSIELYSVVVLGETSRTPPKNLTKKIPIPFSAFNRTKSIVLEDKMQKKNYN